jgi:nucleotide-binding universal stress UspA family protein
MYEHILVPTDGSRLSNAAVEKTLAFAKEVGARVTLLSVLQPFHVFSFDAEQLESTRAEYERNAPQHAGRYLAAAANRAKIMGCSVRYTDGMARTRLSSDHRYCCC